MSPKEIIEALCACRKVGANYLLNIGPTAHGRIPEYESATLSRVGQWVKLHAEAIYYGKPIKTVATAPDFALEANGKFYLFVHNLAIGGHANVTFGIGGAGPRAFSGISRKISSVRWVDNAEILKFSQKDELLCIDATSFPYGTNLVVRIAEAR